MPPAPLVAIVGRPNVGKSTLFNRLIRRRQAVVDDQPGVTRDRIYAHAEWAGRPFRLVDTGGLVPDSKDPMERAVQAQAQVAMEEAALVMLVVDVRTGITDLDASVAASLRRSRRPVLLVANKADTLVQAQEVWVFQQLGLGEPRPVSAISGQGTGDLLDAVIAALEPEPARDPGGEGDSAEPPPLSIAILGRPNVGKSSFVNTVCGHERVIVSPQAGTTRDPADVVIRIGEQPVTLVDTAGLRRRSKVDESIEYYSALRAMQSLDRCDAALLLIDASEGVAHQDARLLEHILQRGKAVVLAVNKWDLVPRETGTAEQWERDLRDQLPFASFVPVIFISALTGQRTRRALERVMEAGQARRTRITTSVFNRFLEEIIHGNEAITPAIGDARISYALQTGIEPPTFLFFVNDPHKVKPNFRRFLERRIREHFNFDGTPVRLRFRAKA